MVELDGVSSAAENHVEAGAKWEQCEGESEDSQGPQRMCMEEAPVGEVAGRK
jgi:hypothetical protein